MIQKYTEKQCKVSLGRSFYILDFPYSDVIEMEEELR